MKRKQNGTKWQIPALILVWATGYIFGHQAISALAVEKGIGLEEAVLILKDTKYYFFFVTYLISPVLIGWGIEALKFFRRSIN